MEEGRPDRAALTSSCSLLRVRLLHRPARFLAQLRAEPQQVVVLDPPFIVGDAAAVLPGAHSRAVHAKLLANLGRRHPSSLACRPHGLLPLGVTLALGTRLALAAARCLHLLARRSAKRCRQT